MCVLRAPSRCPLHFCPCSAWRLSGGGEGGLLPERGGGGARVIQGHGQDKEETIRYSKRDVFVTWDRVGSTRVQRDKEETTGEAVFSFVKEKEQGEGRALAKVARTGLVASGDEGPGKLGAREQNSLG